ncbi:S1 family peptidase [Candidatus Uabimicrobium amorphum]|uniref:Serine protease n=1 Tax=Uabimicrobium amorphum TaxID=2596890 RepID=A0A5S9IQ70_UABAM|nr:serine protease [Candidatus Uabimicrobium amorphum]BBM85874.1 serine protease [Candidatus Uabimicrobium amorphum]
MRIFFIFLFFICSCFYSPPQITTPYRGSIGKEDHETERFLLEKIAQTKTATTKQLISQLSTTKCTLKTPMANHHKMTGSDIYQQYTKSVVIVAQRYLCGNCSQWHVATSSGFMISESGACVTSYHVIDDNKAERFIVISVDKKCYGIERVLAADKHNDFVVLQLIGHKFPMPAPLAKPTIGRKVYVISHPQRRYYSLTSGIISRLFTPESRSTNIPYVTITADYATGSSGAPIFDEYGNVIGVVSYTQSAYAGRDVQMVFKNATNAIAILKVVKVSH